MIERLDIKDYENKEQLVWFGVINKINALVDAVNSLRDDCNLLMGYIAPENKCEPITLIDMFNEMGRLYADLWNKMEDIHYDLKNKGGNNE